jgi:hypothetical protein
MKIISVKNGIVTYQDDRGLIIRDETQYYKSRCLVGHPVHVFCPHCKDPIGIFDQITDVVEAKFSCVYTCERGHTFCYRCAIEHESGKLYCPVCQDAAQERFFIALKEHGFAAALAEFDPTASKQALYRACRERGIDVVYYQGNVYLVHGRGDSLVFDGVPIRDYILFLSQLFYVDDEELQELGMDKVNTPQDFARVVEYRPYYSWTGGAQFGTFYTLGGKRGWVYETLSVRRLYFIFNHTNTGAIYCSGLDESIDFLKKITSFFGVPFRANLPDIGDIAWVQRPRRDEDGNLYVPDNRYFWEIARKK